MAKCETCTFRARYDAKPRSILGRLWKWHIGWCPGWSAYIKSLPEEKKEEMRKRYGQKKK